MIQEEATVQNEAVAALTAEMQNVADEMDRLVDLSLEDPPQVSTETTDPSLNISTLQEALARSTVSDGHKQSERSGSSSQASPRHCGDRCIFMSNSEHSR
jgi:hypothetical protein